MGTPYKINSETTHKKSVVKEFFKGKALGTLKGKLSSLFKLYTSSKS
jgi:hypothetical protein